MDMKIGTIQSTGGAWGGALARLPAPPTGLTPFPRPRRGPLAAGQFRRRDRPDRHVGNSRPACCS